MKISIINIQIYINISYVFIYIKSNQKLTLMVRLELTAPRLEV